MPDVIAALQENLKDRYIIERELGAGGMATVYLAHDIKHDRKVAIKVLKPELAAVLGADRFVVEIKTTAALQHPHILPLFDSGTAGAFLFYVMPYIQGETIREKLNRETQFGVDEAIRIAREVADALDYAHRHGVIHRDIKPENILLHDGRAMVMDFGIALAVSAAAGGRMTETGLSLGTPHYMSPEQATAEKEITPRSDVYSIASVLYEMLAGQPPHIGGAAQQVIMKIITETAQPVTALRKSVPQNVAVALAKALEKLPADRFENAKAFGDALANPTFASTQSAAWSATGLKTTGVNRTAFAATAALALVAMAAAVWGWTRPEAPREVTRLSLFFPDSQALARETQTNRATISPDGRTIVYAGPGQTSTSSGVLWMRSLDQLRATPIPGTEGGGNPAFSPNGHDIVFTSTSGKRAIKRVSLRGGPATVLTDSLVDLGGTTWADDGYIYFDAHLEGDGVARVKETGGAPEIVTKPDNAAGETYHFQPAALPNARGLLFTISRGAGNFAAWDIGVLDARTGKHKVLTHGLRAWYAQSGHLVYVTDGGALMAAPFDLDALALTGDAVAIADGVAVVGNARIDLAMSNAGSLFYTGGRATIRKRELVWVARDGSATPVDPEWVNEFSGRPSLSPDARAVAVAIGMPGTRQVWVKQLDRGPASRVADLGTSPSWSNDGKFVVFSVVNEIRRVPADGSALPVHIRTAPIGGSPPVYASDGMWILFQSQGDIVGMRTDGDSTLQRLVVEGGTQGGATVSPDGKWLAYYSDETGTSEVYVRPFPDTKVAKRQVSVTGGAFPTWSRDGRELLYVDPYSAELVSVPIIPGAAFTTGVPKRLFSVQQFAPVSAMPFDISPDGRRFLFTRGVGAATETRDEVVLVQNFVEELKAKVKAK